MATIEELEIQIRELKSTVSTFQENESKKQRNKYNTAYETLRNSILKTKEIENIIEKTYEKLGIADLLGDLILINNPYSDKLGFQFIAIIEEKIQSILLKKIPDDPDKNGTKNRFLRIIKKVINNPIADIILNSNPISSVVSNVINTASNFIDSTAKTLQTTQIGKGIKKLAIVTVDEIKNEKLELFKKSVEKYADFYSKMLQTTKQFDTRIDILKNSFDSLYLELNDYNKLYLDELGFLNSATPFVELDTLFQKSTDPKKEINYLEVLEKEAIINGLEFVKSIPNAELEAKRYHREFAKTFNEFIEEYINILKIPIDGKWSEDEIDNQKVQKQIDKLAEYLKSNIVVKEIASINEPRKLLSMASFSNDLIKYSA